MMESLAVSEFGPLYELIMSSPQDASELSREQLNEFFRKLRQSGQKTYDRFKELDYEFNAIREENLELEKVIQSLHENLDKQKETMLQGDIDTYRTYCANEYAPFWNSLDTNSQEFLITAHYLYERSKARATDFSPVILEFCRVFENEMLVKIFKEFIQTQASLSPRPSYQKPAFSKVNKAVDDQNHYGSFFLSSMDMLKILQLMKLFFNNGYEKNLKLFLEQRGFDAEKLSDEEGFIAPGKEYVNSFRNEAAHPNFLQEVKATDCQNKTHYLLGHFISSGN